MQELSKKRIIILLSLAVVIIVLIFKNPNYSASADESQDGTSYIVDEGRVFGTTYCLKYRHTESLKDSIEARLRRFDNSLSTFNKSSDISRINRNDSTVCPSGDFVKMYIKAEEIYKVSGGAFDITVAPLVNACGFGFEPDRNVSQATRDSIKEACVGFDRIKVNTAIHGCFKLIKENKDMMLDASAIAKGQGVDVVAELLERHGITDYMVEIGGEVKAKGVNPKGNVWTIGISRPDDDSTATHYNRLQCSTPLEDCALATSGNYLQFYYKDGKRFSHTIDPRTASPVSHSLLSASVKAKDCMTADALATACMVLGVDSAKAMIERLDGVEAYFIYSNDKGEYETTNTEGFKVNNIE